MRKSRERVSPPDPEDFLRLAAASSPEAAGQLAGTALKEHRGNLDPEGALLLLREVFKAHLHANRPRSAHAVARKMVATGALQEIAHADLGRACSALGWWLRAAQAFRLAARFSPAQRRGIHWGACAAALHYGGRTEEALAALDKALRWSTTARPLHRAHAAMMRLESGQAVEDLEGLVEELRASRASEGYGRYVLGMLAQLRGQPEEARPLLEEFVRRNGADPLKRATLAGELARARRVLGHAR